jgi:hypothetical protein
MSRSYRHTPIYGNSLSESEKEDKRIYNRSWRRQVNQKLGKCDDDTVFPEVNDVGNVWAMAKDGKSYYSNLNQDIASGKTKAHKYLNK